MSESGFIPPHGDYRKLLSYQKSELVFDLTHSFCRRFVDSKVRTRDQMIQAARSGKQNIAEGSRASGTSKEMEIKLTNVARASLEELLLDYEDYLRVHNFNIWEKDAKESLYVRKLAMRSPLPCSQFKEFGETRPAEVLANIAICLIHQANYLLDQQIRKLEKDFIAQGGLRESMTRARLKYRNKPDTS